MDKQRGRRYNTGPHSVLSRRGGGQYWAAALRWRLKQSLQ